MSLTKDELIRRTKAAIRELSAEDVVARLPERPLVLDVREADEVATGQLAGARHVPRGFLELRI